MTPTTGRGLQVVGSLSSRRGVDELPAERGPGRTEWFGPGDPATEAAPAGAGWDLDLDGLL